MNCDRVGWGGEGTGLFDFDSNVGQIIIKGPLVLDVLLTSFLLL